MSPGAHIRIGSRPPGRVRRMSHSKLRQYLFLSDLQTPRGITSSIGLADSCHAWSVQYGRAHHARLTSHPHLCEVSPRSSLRGPQLTGARLRPPVLGWLSPSFGAISCLGRACAADTHIPAPLSSLTPIDPRTLTIIRAYEFCVNRYLKVFYYAKLGARVIRMSLSVGRCQATRISLREIRNISEPQVCNLSRMKQNANELVRRFSANIALQPTTKLIDRRAASFPPHRQISRCVWEVPSKSIRRIGARGYSFIKFIMHVKA